MVPAQNQDLSRGLRFFWPLKWHERQRGPFWGQKNRGPPQKSVFSILLIFGKFLLSYITFKYTPRCGLQRDRNRTKKPLIGLGKLFEGEQENLKYRDTVSLKGNHENLFVYQLI